MKRLFLLLALALGIANAQAQIPTEVTEVMGKCRAAMTNATGLEYEMDMKAGIGPLAMKMHFVVANKGNLNRTLMRMTVLGTEIVTENGFDGTDSWEIDHAAKETQSDTITFTHGNKKKKTLLRPRQTVQQGQDEAQRRILRNHLQRAERQNQRGEKRHRQDIGEELRHSRDAHRCPWCQSDHENHQDPRRPQGQLLQTRHIEIPRCGNHQKIVFSVQF